MRQQLENLVKDIGNASNLAPAPSIPSGAAHPSSSTNAARTDAADPASFQETIQRTIRRMQDSGEQATAAATASASQPSASSPEITEDMLAEMLKALQASTDNPPSSGPFTGIEGEGDAPTEEEFSKLLVNMMEQLTNKDILYEPMKELHEKFPSWLDQNRNKISEGDLKRYEEQSTLVREIVHKFEEQGYSDDDPKSREWIAGRMQKVFTPIIYFMNLLSLLSLQTRHELSFSFTPAPPSPPFSSCWCP